MRTHLLTSDRSHSELRGPCPCLFLPSSAAASLLATHSIAPATGCQHVRQFGGSEQMLNAIVTGVCRATYMPANNRWCLLEAALKCETGPAGVFWRRGAG